MYQEATDSQRHAPFNLNELLDSQKSSNSSCQPVPLHNYYGITQNHIHNVQIIRDLLVEFSKAISKNSSLLSNAPSAPLTHTQPLQHQNIGMQVTRAATHPTSAGQHSLM